MACDRVEELLDVFLRSWCCPVLNCTSNGDDGCDPRLGEEVAPLIDGEDGRPVPLVESARFNGAGNIGLDSKDGDGEDTPGD